MSGAQPTPHPNPDADYPTAIQRFVESQKTAWTVYPVRPIPIKPEYPLYTHQVKAYNIALALMGYDPEGGTTHDPS